MFHYRFGRVPNADEAAFSPHCNNDLALAVADTLAALMAGARQVEVTVNGIGKRAGNAAVEVIAMALHVRRDVWPFTADVNATEITRASRMVDGITGTAT